MRAFLLVIITIIFFLRKNYYQQHLTSSMESTTIRLSLHQLHFGTSSSIFNSTVHSSITSFSFDSPLCSSITRPTSLGLFHPALKPTYITNTSTIVSLPPPDYLHGLSPGPFLLSYSVFLVFLIFSLSDVPCARLSWPCRQLLSARIYIVSYRIISLCVCVST